MNPPCPQQHTLPFLHAQSHLERGPCTGFGFSFQAGVVNRSRGDQLKAKSQIVSSILNVAHQFIREVNPHDPKGENHSTKEVEMTTSKRAESTNKKDGPLCEGSFDEEASARSFQEVLNQWRTGNHENTEKENLRGTKPDSVEACEVQTNLKIWREPLEIEFKEDSLSYIEKLWLKKHRRTPQDQLLNIQPATFIRSCKTTSETQFSQDENDENDDNSDVEETKVQHPALFLPVENREEVRPEPSLKIIELDDTYEEEFEEPDVVPYKVELADADSQQSWIFHDFQKNTFPYQNDIYQLNFTKEKTGLLNLCPSNSSSYCKNNSKAGTPSTDFDNIAHPDVCFSATEEIEESSLSERNLKEKSVDIESNQNSDDSSTSLKSKDSLPSIDLEEPSIEEKLSQDIKESLEFNNLYERPNLEDTKTAEPPLAGQAGGGGGAATRATSCPVCPDMFSFSTESLLSQETHQSQAAGVVGHPHCCSRSRDPQDDSGTMMTCQAGAPEEMQRLPEQLSQAKREGEK
ncbi:zinc finger B-box domain-containing protein 1-like [Choloepus didactylus]|uniref:zinc finger B-box domain-containing protein 1-like n=1 Tax=Choloepus didactylus TaxID=27675 RepID=UPI00189DB757|nr:zinc finger B-box domain-containing protein 1-like [Choloepus didactylus]